MVLEFSKIRNDMKILVLVISWKKFWFHEKITEQEQNAREQFRGLFQFYNFYPNNLPRKIVFHMINHS